MQLVNIINPADFEAALSSALQVGQSRPVQGLAAPIDAGVIGRIAEAWDGIEEALRGAYEYGIEKVHALVHAAVDKAEKILEGAKTRAREIHAVLMSRLQEYLSRLTEGALARVIPIVEIGDRKLQLVHVQVSHKLLISGSLKATITEVCSITSSGELAVVAQYA